MNDREQRGLAIAALYRVEQTEDGKWTVPSQTRDGRTYTVDPANCHCDCPDHEQRAVKCKHMFAVEFVQTRERNRDGSETVTKTFKVTERVTYAQDWPKYNKAQTQEKRIFLSMLAELCRGVPEPPANPKGGRPSYPMADMVFSVVFKVYSNLSARRFTCDLQEAAEKGHVRKAPHFNTVMRTMEDAALAPILQALIVESSKPLAAVEKTFASDSTGFSVCRFDRWFDMKYGKTMAEKAWVKVHVMTGTLTNVVTAVRILDKNANDCPQFKPLLDTTRETFTIGEVSADAAYSSGENLQAVVDAGGTPYIAFKESTTGGVGGIFAKMFHYYSYNKDEFLEHYHRRSNVESTFSMVKGKFGDAIRSKSDDAMVNEALCKILCHNICCLIHSLFELGIVAKFWGRDEREALPAPETNGTLEALAWM